MAKQAIRDEKTRNKILRLARSKDIRHFTLLVIGIYSGFRISDILAMKVGDILGADNFKIKEAKTKKLRYLPIHPKIIKTVRKMASELELTFNDLIFHTDKDKTKPINTSTCRRWMSYYGDKFGLDLSTHSMRKTFGYINYVNTGGDLSILQTMLNHKSQSDTLRYIGIEQDDINNAVLSMK